MWEFTTEKHNSDKIRFLKRSRMWLSTLLNLQNKPHFRKPQFKKLYSFPVNSKIKLAHIQSYVKIYFKAYISKLK